MKKGFKYGVEIECAIPLDYKDEINAKLRQLGVECGGDPTIRGYPSHYTSQEYKTPPLPYNKMYRHIGQVCDVLKSYEAYVNHTCGLHIHTSNIRFKSQKYLKRIIHTFVAIEDVLITTQPPSRYGSEAYNRRLLREYVFDKELKDLPRVKSRLISKIQDTNKQQNLNISSLLEHNTIENRLHAGTTDKKKIRAWLHLNRRFYIYCLTKYKSKDVTNLFKTKISQEKIDKVFDLLEVKPEYREFYNTRVKRFLFENLAREQESAYKTLELLPAKEKMARRYDKIQREMHELESNLHEVSRPLSRY